MERERIAIVGMGAVLPSCRNLQDFWSHTLLAEDLSNHVPDGRWGDAAQLKKYIDPQAAIDHIPHSRGYFVQNSQWEPHGLRLDEEILPRLDPLFHYTLQAGRDAFFDCEWSAVDREQAGVILGNLALPTEFSSRFVHETLGRSFQELQFQAMRVQGAGIDPINYFPASMPSVLLAKALGFGGKSLSLDAACASSLYAIKFACDELLQGRASLMLAGGVCRPDSLFTQMGFHQLQALSRSGKSRPFDHRADGLMVGEGGAILALKRLSDARQANDHIYGVIAGIGLSNDMDGRLMAPSEAGQLRAMRAAYHQAGWGPDHVSYLECHATGTQLGDQTELQSWLKMRQQVQAKNLTPCVLSSSKGNIGHLLTASGAAGLIRLLLCMHEKTLAPTANFASLTPHLQAAMQQGASTILQEFRLWDTAKRPRRAAISAFGFGGTNAHLLIEEWISEQSSVLLGNTRQLIIERQETAAITPAVEPIAIVGIGVHSGTNRDWRLPRSWLKSCRQAAKQPKLWFGSQLAPWFIEQYQGLDFSTCAWQEMIVPYGEFRIPPQEFPDLLPQQVAMLLAASQATHDAGWTSKERDRSAVFVGLDVDGMANAFRTRWTLGRDAADLLAEYATTHKLTEAAQAECLTNLQNEFGPPLTANRVLGSLASLVASRIAREHRCGGMGMTVSMMENSGLMALDRAIQQIRAGDIDEAIVGAVDRCSQMSAMLARHRLWQVQGLPVEEFTEDMALALVIKPQQAALRDGDRIYGLIHQIQGGISHHASSIASVAKAGAARSPEFASEVLLGQRHYHRLAGALLSRPAVHDRLCQLRGQTCENYQELPSIYDDVINQGMASGLTSLVNSLAVFVQSHGNQGSRSVLELSYGSSDGHTMHVLIEPDLAGLAAEASPHQEEAVKSFKIAVQGQPWQAVLGSKKLRTGVPTNSHSSVDAVAVRVNQVTTNSQNNALAAATRPYFVESMAQLASAAMMAEQQAQFSHAALQEQMTRNLHSLYGAWRQQCAASPTERLPAALPSPDEQALFDFEACREFAEGMIQNVFGPDFAEVDRYPTRVRLPMDRLLLCHRVMALQGEAKSLKSGVLVTEHDVREDSWYLDHYHIPTAIAIEAGQADLMLSAWLGADFHTKGQAVYRLLDAKVVFHSALPQPGEVIRYRITIEGFFHQGQTLFFRFGFVATVADRPLLTMEDGCAGFFSADELNSGRGIVKPGFMEKPQMSGQVTGGYQPLFDFSSESYHEAQLDALRAGDLVGCFGSAFANLALSGKPLTIPGGDLRLVHRITKLQPAGGWFGLGLVIGEADIEPDDWFLICHFKDDHVMPGTLMYECCLHTLRVYLLRMGWVGAEGSLHVGPVPGIKSQLKCRGQVLSHTKTVRYELHIREMGFQPDAYVLADALMYADDKLIVDIENMSLSLQGLQLQDTMDMWSDFLGQKPVSPEMIPCFSQEQILEFATGRPSLALGEQYLCFDEARRMARLPRPPYQFISEILTTNVSAGQLAAGGQATARYLIPDEIWYFADEPGQTMPFSILLEVGLQACGWMAAFMGSALLSDQDLFFRNLQGKGRLLQPVGKEQRYLLAEVRCTNVSRSADMILQSYHFRISTEQTVVYEGNTNFGFFTKAALADQKGLRQSDLPSLPDDLPSSLPEASPRPQCPLQMVSGFYRFEPQAGQYQRGRALAYKTVYAEEWFFHAHFYQDPVMPGSLGLEGFVQVMRQIVQVLSPEEAPRRSWRLQPGSEQEWVYRGQVRPYASLICYDLHVKDWDNQTQTLVADGYLWVDGLPIYRITNFTLSGIAQ